ncbi:MAG: redoxin domain-containing protein [Planctomycetes bacterium]|nr:redoxin domain-containing protein [Planctomycetota bacterium]
MRRTLRVCVAVVFVGLLLGRGRITQQIALRQVLAATAPSPQAIEHMLAESTEPGAMAVRLWSQGRLAHQRAVVDALRGNVGGMDAATWRTVDPILRQAPHSPDLDVVEASLAMLVARADRRAVCWVSAYQSDADPERRALWLRYLAAVGQYGDAALAADSIEDKDPYVSALALAALRQCTGAWFESADPVQTARQWVAAHREELSPAANCGPPTRWTLGAIDFDLRDLDGHPVRLSDFRGRVVLVNFWATWCGPCIAEVPDLIELNQRRGDDLVVLGVAVDAVPHDHAHRPGDAHDEAAERERHVQQVRRIVKQYGINYPVLIDDTGVASAAYRAEGVPVSVWFDAEGRIARRLTGPRSITVFEAMYRWTAE